MDLSWKIDLIDQMIRENPEYTIQDYFNLLAEIKQIKPDEMNTPLLYTAEQAEFMIKHHDEYTAAAIAMRLDLPESVVRNFGSRYRLTYKKAKSRVAVKNPEPQTDRRPAASYSNTGFISVTQKYAS